MKRQQLSVMVALAAALLFACAAHAQQAPPRTRQPQPRTMQCTSGGNCYDNNTTDRDINATDNDDTPRNNPKFSSLAGSQRYVSESDTAGHQWRASHFSECDGNYDDKLSRAEYRHCRQAYGHGQP